MKYVVDTNIFNRILDGQPKVDELVADLELVATHIQIDEIKQTINDHRRYELLRLFTLINPATLPTESGLWGISQWGMFKWGDGARLNSIICELDAKERRASNSRDALIAEVAEANGFGLVTADRILAEVMTNRGVLVKFVVPFHPP